MSAARVEAKEIRVGVCECTNVFGDRLNGREFNLAPYAFRVVQVPVVGGDHTPDIKNQRTHFFLDTVDNTGETRLNLIKLYPPKAPGGEELIRAGHRSDQSKWWDGTVPTPEAIVRGMATILENMGSVKLGVWLDRMTPAGWAMQARSLVLASPSCDISK